MKRIVLAPVIFAMLLIAGVAFGQAGPAPETGSTAAPGGSTVAPAVPRPEPPLGGPQLQAKVSLMVKIGDGVAFGVADVNYLLFGQSATSLSLSLPPDVTVGTIHGQRIKSHRQEMAGDRNLITVEFDTEVTGSYMLYIEYERVTRSEDSVEVPIVRPEGVSLVELKTDPKKKGPPERIVHPEVVSLVEGYIGVTAIQSLEVRDHKIANLRQIDPSQLRGALFESSENLIPRAYAYTWVRNVGKDPALFFNLIRHQDVAVKDAFIDEARYMSLVRPEGFYITKAVFSIRNKNHHSLKLTLPEGSELWSAFLADQPVPVVKDEQGRLLIALPKSEFGDAGDLTNFPVEVVFETRAEKLEGFGKLTLPLPQTDITVGKLRWHLYLPTDRTYRSFEGTIGEAAKDARSEKDISADLSDFALGLSGNFLKFQARSKQSEAKTNLGAIFTTQAAYFKKFQSYAPTFQDLGWTPEGRNAYSYIMGQDRIDNAVGRAEFMGIEGTAVTPTGFVALAVGDIDNDPFPDVWAITQEKQLVNLANDATDAYSADFEEFKAKGLFGEFGLESLKTIQEHVQKAELRGMLSIKIQVPTEGRLVRFEKLFAGTQGEELVARIRYMPASFGHGARFLGRLLALSIGIVVLLAAAVLVRRSERLAFVRRHWWLTVLVVIGLALVLYRLWVS